MHLNTVTTTFFQKNAKMINVEKNVMVYVTLETLLVSVQLVRGNMDACWESKP